MRATSLTKAPESSLLIASDHPSLQIFEQLVVPSTPPFVGTACAESERASRLLMTQTGMDSLPGAFQEKAVAGSNHRHFHLVECSLLDLTRNVDAQIRTERSSGHFLSCQCCGGEVYDNDDGLFVLPLPSQTRDQLRVTGPALQCPVPFHLRVTFLHFVRHPYRCWTYGWCGSRGQTGGLAKSILPGSFPRCSACTLQTHVRTVS